HPDMPKSAAESRYFHCTATRGPATGRSSSLRIGMRLPPTWPLVESIFVNGFSVSTDNSAPLPTPWLEEIRPARRLGDFILAGHASAKLERHCANRGMNFRGRVLKLPRPKPVSKPRISKTRSELP